ncbi:MAG TPA: amino acid ABC transporter permease [Actinomycetota bacterium]|nr:amino acid ABC transporter permease [Actinomycetota bacterium]
MSSTPAGAPLPPEPLPTGDRRSRILSGGTRVEGRRAVAIALASTAIFLTVIAVVAVNSAGWGEFSDKFLNWQEFWDSFPGVARAFLVNIQLFLIAEVLVLILAMGVAVLRSLPGPVFFPIRILAAVYTDLFRGIPTVLVIYTLGFGAPALQIQGVPKSPFFWAVVSLVLVYTAYVAEVYRAGIESVHESQVAAARSLGLTRWQSTRYVVLPQAVRRIIPPLLNDFLGLQKDTALVALIGVIEAFRQGQIDSSATFNFTPLLATAFFFVLITIPLARFIDWLVTRDRRRRQAGGLA